MTALATRGRRTRHGYVVVAPGPVRRCPSPIVASRLRVTDPWIRGCFVGAYQRALGIWGPHPGAIAAEITAELLPSMRLRPDTGAEHELQRRIELAVAAMLNSAGVPTPYPRRPVTPRPLAMPAGPPWERALLTGWLQ